MLPCTNLHEYVFSLNGLQNFFWVHYDTLTQLLEAQVKSNQLQVIIRGSDQQGASFVGIAFHGEHDENYHGIYFRPFNFNAEDANGRSHNDGKIGYRGGSNTAGDFANLTITENPWSGSAI